MWYSIDDISWTSTLYQRPNYLYLIILPGIIHNNQESAHNYHQQAPNCLLCLTYGHLLSPFFLYYLPDGRNAKWTVPWRSPVPALPNSVLQWRYQNNSTCLSSSWWGVRRWFWAQLRRWRLWWKPERDKVIQSTTRVCATNKQLTSIPIIAIFFKSTRGFLSEQRTDWSMSITLHSSVYIPKILITKVNRRRTWSCIIYT